MDKKLFPCALIRAGEQSVRAEIPKRDSSQLGTLVTDIKEDSDMTVPEILSYVVSGASIVAAIWQTVKNSNLKKYIRTEEMEAYSNTGMLLGSTQGCLRELQAGNTNLVIQEGGKSEGIAQALFTRSIKNIHHHFAYTRKDIDDWITKKKIQDYHKDAFLKYAEK
jgi:hypothetical protein